MRNPEISRRDFLRLAAASTAGAVFAVADAATDQGKTPTIPPPIPNSDFYPVVIPGSPNIKDNLATGFSSGPDPLPSRQIPVESSNSSERIQELPDSVLNIMLAHEDFFSTKYIADIKMYYPMYKAVADKYNMDWYLLWIVHENETGASAPNSKGLSKDSYYVGAMQRDPNTWPQTFVDKAASGLDFLASLPQRQKNDWKEIAAGAAILNRNINQYQSLGEDKAVYNALSLYSAQAPADKRFSWYTKIKGWFNQ